MHRLGRNLALLTLLTLATSVVVPRESLALDRDAKAVLTASEYGLLIGTLVGVATVPLSQNARSIFLGSSVGLYLGIAIGIYHVTHREDPNNPLRMNRDEFPRPKYDRPSGQLELPKPEIQIQFAVLRF